MNDANTPAYCICNPSGVMLAEDVSHEVATVLMNAMPPGAQWMRCMTDEELGDSLIRRDAICDVIGYDNTQLLFNEEGDVFQSLPGFGRGKGGVLLVATHPAAKYTPMEGMELVTKEDYELLREQEGKVAV